MRFKITMRISVVTLAAATIISSSYQSSPTQMVQILKDLYKRNYTSKNQFNPEAINAHVDSLLKIPGNEHCFRLLLAKGSVALKVGEEQQSVQAYNDAIKEMG